MWELAHTIMEAEKSHDMPSASWKISGIIQSQPKGRRTKSSDVGGQERWMSQLKKKEGEIALRAPFCSVWALSGLE